MRVVVRPCLSAVMVGAGVLSTTLAHAPAVGERVSTQQFSLTAASSTVPANLITLIRNIPAWEVQAMDRLADAMIATGSWQVWGPTNVLGFDELDPPKLTALIGMLVPIEPVSSALGDQFSWWARANLPMNAGCAARPGACPDPRALVRGSFTVPMSTLNSGYQFPTVRNPFTGQETSWSGQYVTLQPGAARTALVNYLNGPVQPLETVTFAEFSSTAGKLAKSVTDAFAPFVQNSEWFNRQQTVLAPLFTALAPITCSSCDPDRPYNNPWLYENYRPNGAAASAAVRPAAALEVESPAAAPARESVTPDAPQVPETVTATGHQRSTVAAKRHAGAGAKSSNTEASDRKRRG